MEPVRIHPDTSRAKVGIAYPGVPTTPLNASSHRFFLFWAEPTVDSVRPAAMSVDRSWGQRRAVRIILGPRNAEAAPPPVLGAPHQVGPHGVPLDRAAHREETSAHTRAVSGSGTNCLPLPTLQAEHP
jgi:hypothetical protein